MSSTRAYRLARMTNTPQVHNRGEQPYVALHHTVSMDGFSAVIDSGFAELFGWLGQRGIAPASAPMIRYNRIDIERTLDIELAVPISVADADGLQGDSPVRKGSLPAGRYATLHHVGAYDGLIASNAALQDWAKQVGLTFDVTASATGEQWASRVEIYTTNPAEEPDPSKWEVEISYRLAD
jgi:effector-binding domain-containing protein